MLRQGLRKLVRLMKFYLTQINVDVMNNLVNIGTMPMEWERMDLQLLDLMLILAGMAILMIL